MACHARTASHHHEPRTDPLPPHRHLPIDCEFHDLLEERATLRKPTRINFRDESGALQHRDTVITDVFARDGAEYLSTITGEELRLDQLVEVDGQRLADYQASACRL